MPGGRGTGPNGCCCRLCPSLPTPVLALGLSAAVRLFKSNSDGTITLPEIEDDSPPSGTPNCNILSWRQGDKFLLSSSATTDNGVTLWARDTTCARILNYVPVPSDPCGQETSFNLGNDIGFSNGPSGYLFTNAGSQTQQKLPTAVNSPSGWTNPSAVEGAASFATTSGGGADLIATGFGFSIPTIPASMKLVSISLEVDHLGTVSNDAYDVSVYFTKDGSTAVGSNLAVPHGGGTGYWPTVKTTQGYTGDVSLFSISDVNSSTLGVIFNCAATTGICEVQNFRIIIGYTVDGSQVYLVSSSAPMRIAVMPHSTGTIRCFSNDDYCIAPPTTAFGAGSATYSGPFTYSFDGVSFTAGTIDTITFPSTDPGGWYCLSARFAQDQTHCGFALRTTKQTFIDEFTPAAFYVATRSGTNLASPTQIVFTASVVGYTAIGLVWAISPDGSLLAFRAINNAGTVDRVHIYKGGSLVAELAASGQQNNENIYQLGFTDDGKQLVACYGTSDPIVHGRTQIWSVSPDGLTYTQVSQPSFGATIGAAFTHGYRVP